MQVTRPKGGIPRGLDPAGPVLFSYGFRPFFLGASVWAALSMALWLLAIAGIRPLGGRYGAVDWHAHEMLFGFAPAVLAGFLLTSVPNWTGRLPVAGRPLMALFGLWCAGRLAMLCGEIVPSLAAAVLDGVFLPVFLLACAREIVAGRRWKDLKPIAALSVLAAANIVFHLRVLAGMDAGMAERLALSTYVLLITAVGGRMVPSFTRNWLNQHGVTAFPAPHGALDRIALTAGLVAFSAWTIAPEGSATGMLCLAAALLHARRLSRWRGLAVSAEPLLLALHLSYAFVPLGLASMAAGAAGLLPPHSVLHVLSIGALGGMMLAVMARSTRGHAGRVLSASPLTMLSYGALFLAALLRPVADLVPPATNTFLATAGLLWIAAFGLFVVEYGPMLATVRRKPRP